MKKYGLYGKLQAKNGQGDALAAILLEASKLMTVLDVCHLYLVSQAAEDSDAIWVTGVWDSKEAHDASLRQDKVRTLIGKAMPLLDDQPESGQTLKVLGGL